MMASPPNEEFEHPYSEFPNPEKGDTGSETKAEKEC